MRRGEWEDIKLRMNKTHEACFVLWSCWALSGSLEGMDGVEIGLDSGGAACASSYVRQYICQATWRVQNTCKLKEVRIEHQKAYQLLAAWGASPALLYWHGRHIHNRQRICQSAKQHSHSPLP